MLIRAWVQDGEIRGGGDWGQSSDLEAGVLEGLLAYSQIEKDRHIE